LADLAAWLSQRGISPPTPARLKTALTHRSAGKNNYERLEFLGDSLVNMVCAQLVYTDCPNASEGEMTRMRANLVDEASLAAFARQLNLSDHLILGGGELKSGGYRRDSILADTFEALCAAIYLDHGHAAMRAFLEPILRAAMPLAAQKAEHKDAKTQLQEYLQDGYAPVHSRGAENLGLVRPSYSVLETFGQEHNREFLVRCDVQARPRHAAAHSTGRGSSLKRAEQAAAAEMLELLRAAPKTGAVTAL
jgi:ribonuclease III